MTEVKLVWAEARGGAIGRDGQMPWHLPEDLAHFKQATLGTPVIMGRRTWESLPERFRPLPGRLNIIVSRDEGYVAKGAETVSSFDAALSLAKRSTDGAISVIGGGQIYRAAMPSATELVVTRIELDIDDADTYAPEIGPNWRLRDSTAQRTSADGIGYRFESYVRRDSEAV